MAKGNYLCRHCSHRYYGKGNKCPKCKSTTAQDKQGR